MAVQGLLKGFVRAQMRPGAPKMSQKFALQKRQDDAAHLMAEGRFTLCEIASRCEIDRRTLFRWRAQPNFAAKVLTMTEQMNEAAMERGITRRAYRINQLSNMESDLRRVEEERAADPSMADVPGGKTGLVVRRPVVGGGKVLGYEYEVDHATISAILDIHAQVAKELGQWTKLRAIEASVSHLSPDDPTRLSEEELEKGLKELVERIAPLLPCAQASA